MANTLKFGNGQWATKEGSTLAYNDENGNFKPLPFDFSRSTSATRVNKDGLIELVSNNEPRIDFLNDSNGALLLEPSRSNLITYSEDFTNASWTKNVSVLANSTISPDGTTNAGKILETTSIGQQWAYQTLSLSGAQTATIYAKKAERNYVALATSGLQASYFDLDTGVVVSSASGATTSIESVGNGWYRCSVTSTSSAGNFFVVWISDDGTRTSYAGDNTKGIYIWGAQNEAGSYATSYIPTQGSSVTRVRDTCSDAGNDQVINSTEGVLFAKLSFLTNDLATEAISLTNGSTSERVVIYKWVLLNQIRVRVFKGGVQQVQLAYTVSDITSVNKIAFKYKENDFALWINGQKVANTQSGLTPIGLNELGFNDNGSTGSLLSANVNDVKVYNTALTDQELQTLTTI